MIKNGKHYSNDTALSSSSLSHLHIIKQARFRANFHLTLSHMGFKFTITLFKLVDGRRRQISLKYTSNNWLFLFLPPSQPHTVIFSIYVLHMHSGISIEF